MNNNDPITKGDLQALKDFIRQEYRNRVNNFGNKVDNRTDTVVEGFSNTEQILSDSEGKPVELTPKQTKIQLQESKKQKPT